MPSLGEAFKLPETRVQKTIVAIDLSNSTSMKIQNPEAKWIPTYEWFFDLLGRTIDPSKGRVVKYLGDGALAVFGEDYVADGINWAVEIQENILDAQRDVKIDCDCSIGMASGKVVEFQTPDGWIDYIGTVVDRAFRLCSAANSKAVFVDTVTVSAAAMTKVKSRFGTITDPQREGSDYQGSEQKITAKGFAQPIRYHEILWSSGPYGVSKEFVSDQLQSTAPTLLPLPLETKREVPHAESEWNRGTVNMFNGTYGFIRSGSGEDFYFNSEYLFRYSNVPVTQDIVFFNILDALPDSRNRRATNVIVKGSMLSGKLHRPVSPAGFGFVLCPNEVGEMKEVFVFFGAQEPWSKGMEVQFTVGENQKGLAGEDPRPVEPAPASE